MKLLDHVCTLRQTHYDRSTQAIKRFNFLIKANVWRPSRPKLQKTTDGNHSLAHSFVINDNSYSTFSIHLQEGMKLSIIVTTLKKNKNKNHKANKERKEKERNTATGKSQLNKHFATDWTRHFITTLNTRFCMKVTCLPVTRTASGLIRSM